MSEKQEFVSNIWLERSKEIHTTSDRFNLTALREGKIKHAAEVDFILKTGLITDTTTLLDLACGNGRLCEAFGGKIFSVTGTDLCEDFIIYLNNKKLHANHDKMIFLKLDLLEKDYTKFFKHDFSLIFLFGATQLIIEDENLLGVLRNIKKILSSNGHLLIKQTTSLNEQDIYIDHYSQELKHRWVATYRNPESISRLCSLANMKVVSFKPIYSKSSLGEDYEKVEKWPDTRQIIFDVVHA